MPQAWALVRPETIVKAFLRCGISNDMEGLEDDAVFDDQQEDADEQDDEFDDGVLRFEPESVKLANA